MNHPDEFLRRFDAIEPTIDEWKRQRRIIRESDDALDLGFAFFFLNRTNRSGVADGVMIGGLLQEGRYKVWARCNKSKLRDKLPSSPATGRTSMSPTWTAWRWPRSTFPGRRHSSTSIRLHRPSVRRQRRQSLSRRADGTAASRPRRDTGKAPGRGMDAHVRRYAPDMGTLCRGHGRVVSVETLGRLAPAGNGARRLLRHDLTGIAKGNGKRENGTRTPAPGGVILTRHGCACPCR